MADLKYENGAIVRHQGKTYTVVGRSEDRTYNLGRRTADGWEQVAHEVPEKDLTPTTLVEHHYNGVMVGHIEADERERILAARQAGTMIGFQAAETPAVAAADAGKADDRR